MAVDSRVPDHEELRARLMDALGDRYEVEGVTGEGGTSIVFRALDRKYARPVAIKVLKPDHTDARSTGRFLREVRISASLEHPSIVPVFDSGEIDGLPYFVMPFFRGESLRDRLAAGVSLPLDVAVRITRDVADALTLAHREGILHRDVKPGNILLVGGRAMLMDFGVARALYPEGSSTMTTGGVVVGTPSYMSPEQAGGEPKLDEGTDQYSLACVLFEMLAGEPLFSGNSTAVVLTSHLTEAPRPLRTLRPEIPEGVEQALLRALGKDPSKRFESVEAFVWAVEEGSGTPRRRAGRFGKAGSVLGVAALAAAVYLAWPWTPRSVEPGVVPESVLVLGMASPTASPAERELAAEFADQIARELNGWDSVRAVGFPSLWSDAIELGISGPIVHSAQDALQLARGASVQQLVTVSVRVSGDSILVDAGEYDPSLGRAVERHTSTGPREAAFSDVIRPLVTWVLHLPDDVELRRGTASREAANAEWLGNQALLGGRLVEAERYLRRAVAADSTWSLALGELALTQYLTAFMQSRGLEVEPGAEVARWSTRATERAGELSDRDRLFVMGVYHLQARRYEESRERFQQIVALDSSDVLGWLMVGVVEMQDRSLLRDASGELVPAANLNVARRAFRTAVARRPTFELGYGTSSKLHDLIRGAVAGGCSAFTEPGWTPESAGELASLEDPVSYCPAMGDSIRWLGFEDFRAIPAGEHYQGTDRLFRESLEDLEHWADLAPNSPAPRHELALARLTERRQQSVGSPDRLRSLAEEALRQEQEALSLRSDTTVNELVLLANLLLAVDRLEEAKRAGQHAVEASRACGGECRLPPGAVNVFLATGLATAALDIVSGYEGERLLERPDGSLLAYAGAMVNRERVKVMAATGVGPELILEEIEAAEALWRSRGYTEADLQQLRNDLATSLTVPVALHPDPLREWAAGVSSESLAWTAVNRRDSGGAAVTSPVERLSSGEGTLPPAERAFILGVLAGKRGDSSAAVRHFSRLDSLPHRVVGADQGWGLRALSLPLRALELDKLGRFDEAAEFRHLFLSAWSDPDPFNEGLRNAALEAAPRDPLH